MTTTAAILDDEALRTVRDVGSIRHGNVQRAITFAALELVATTSWLALFVALRRKGRASLVQVLVRHRGAAATAGIASAICYGLVLVSMAHVTNVSYVVGFRQLSIPVGAILGIILLNEASCPPKYADIAVIFAGLVMIGFG